MTLELQDIETIEAEERVEFIFRRENDAISVRGVEGAVERALARIADHRDSVARILRQRQGLPEPDEGIVERAIPVDVPSLDSQREAYERWLSAKPRYYQPTRAEIDTMWEALQDGDRIFFDFARSVTVVRSSGEIVAIDRKGRVAAPSPYSPAVRDWQRRRAASCNRGILI